ncbi:MAG TPA: MBL fold metallo-hydrolase [Acidobacteriota bacterium]|nr:MBL fold metallo-hydrolase [Acidobacteriota bacterium]
MRVQQISNDLYVAIGDAYDSNSTILLSKGEALLIDAMGSTKDAANLKLLVERELGSSVRFIVCTHFFSDHLAALKFFPKSEIIAHKNYTHTFDLERFRSKEEKTFFVEPTILISDEMTLRWGKYHINVFHNPAHTMSTLNIDIPEADLIHVGDTVVGNMVYFAYSSPSLFNPALNRIKQRGRQQLISSHLEARSTVAVDHAEHYLSALKNEVKQLNNDDEAVLKIELKECLPFGVAATPFETIFHRRNLKSIVEQQLFAY